MSFQSFSYLRKLVRQASKPFSTFAALNPQVCQTPQASRIFSSQAPQVSTTYARQKEDPFPWLAATALGLGALGLSPLVAQCHCIHCPEPDDDKPEETLQKPKERSHGEAEDTLQLLSASPKKKNILPDPDEDEDDQLPPYVPKHFKDDLDNALDHKAELGENAKFGLASHSIYPFERAHVTLAPDVPPPIKRDHPVTLVVDMVTTNKQMNVIGNTKYEYWPFGYYDERERKNKYGVPGPFIRARVGDVLQVNFTNLDQSGMAHSIDFHSVCGPGGGSPTNFAEQDETKVGAYLLEKPGLYIYHCAAAPIPVHIHNGMFGLILVEPAKGLPRVDKEVYIMQHKLYLEKDEDDEKTYEMDYDGASKEIP
jgi:plastocyanin